MRHLVELLDGELGGAIEYDIITHGRRLRDLGTPAFPWRELVVILQNQPLTSAFARAQRGAAADFHVGEYLQVGVINLLKGIQWQLSGNADAPQPELYYPPGAENPEAPKQISDAYTIEAMNEKLAAYFTPEG